MTVAAFDRLRTAEDVRTLYIHEKASDAIRAMFAQVDRIKRTFGPYAEYEKAVTSLHQCLANLLRTAWSREAYVTRDQDDVGLSLYVQDGTFVFGIVWFRDRIYDGTEQAGIAGEWSCHS